MFTSTKVVELLHSCRLHLIAMQQVQTVVGRVHCFSMIAKT